MHKKSLLRGWLSEGFKYVEKNLKSVYNTLHILSHNLQVKSQFNIRFSKKQVYALQNSYFYLSTFILSSCQMALHKKVTFKMGNHDEGHSSTNIHKHWNIKIQRAILEPLSKH